MAKLDLRPYQKEALEKVLKSFNEKTHRQLLVLPTGAGKTCLFIAITQHYRKKTLILAHRDELITQAYEKFKKFWPKADVGIYKGKKHNINHRVIISSIQTCSRQNRLEKFKKKGFDVLVIDEAHHATSDSYQKIIKELGFLENSEKLLIGVTATPNRSDKQSLKSIFQEITYSISIEELIKSKYLVPVIARRCLTDFKLRGIKTYLGDFAVSQLAEAVNIPGRNNFIISKWKEHAFGRKTVAFCVNVQHCKDLAAECNKHGIAAAAVWGDMNPTLRKKILDDFSKGLISVISSCSLLIEGFDEPSVACIIMARPTKSQTLYIQMIGRGLRIDDEKKNCLVLDFTDRNNNLNAVISLKDIIPNAEIIVEENTKNKTPTNLTAHKQTIRSDKNVDREFNILGKPKFIWLLIDDEWSLSDDKQNEIVMYKISRLYVADIFFDNGTNRSIVKEPTSFERCKAMCEAWAQNNLTISYANANSQWMLENKNIRASQVQIDFLKRHKAYSSTISKATACTKIRKIVAESKMYYRKKNDIHSHGSKIVYDNTIAQKTTNKHYRH